MKLSLATAAIMSFIAVYDTVRLLLPIDTKRYRSLRGVDSG